MFIGNLIQNKLKQNIWVFVWFSQIYEHVWVHDTNKKKGILSVLGLTLLLLCVCFKLLKNCNPEIKNGKPKYFWIAKTNFFPISCPASHNILCQKSTVRQGRALFVVLSKTWIGYFTVTCWGRLMVVANSHFVSFQDLLNISASVYAEKPQRDIHSFIGTFTRVSISKC